MGNLLDIMSASADYYKAKEDSAGNSGSYNNQTITSGLGYKYIYYVINVNNLQYVCHASQLNNVNRDIYNDYSIDYLPELKISMFNNPCVSNSDKTPFGTAKWDSINELSGYSFNSALSNLKANIQACKSSSPAWWEIHNAKVWCKTLNKMVNEKMPWYGAKKKVNSLADTMASHGLEGDIAYNYFSDIDNYLNDIYSLAQDYY